MDSVERSSPASSGNRPQPVGRKRADTKRDKIVRSAAKLFLEKGYDNVSINDIIDVVGGSKGTIYSNFGSKEKLFEAVVEQMCSDVTIRIDTRPVGTIEEQLTRIAHSFVSKVLSLQILYVSPADDVDRPDLSRGRTAVLRHRAAHGLSDRRGLDRPPPEGSGNIRSDEDPHRLAVLFHDMLIGEHQLSWLTSASSEKDRAKRIDQTVRLAVTVFLQGCAQPEALAASGKRDRSKSDPRATAPSPRFKAFTDKTPHPAPCRATARPRSRRHCRAQRRTRPAPAKRRGARFSICQTGGKGADCVP